jgi:hypothetical protein
MKIAIALCLCLACATTSTAQDLRTACGGAWQEVQSNIGRVRRFDPVVSREGKATIQCLLQAIDDETFAAKDAELNRVLQSQAIGMLIGVYGPANYDVFAELLPAQPEAVKRGLMSALLERGQPEAFQAYFSPRRATVSAHRPLDGNPAAARLLRPLIVHGTCTTSLCSNRLDETLRILRSNLDLIIAELEATEAAATGDSAQNRQIRAEAKELLDTIGRR